MSDQPDNDTGQAAPPPTQFSRLLTSFRNGALDDKVTAALAEVADAVRVTGRTGSVAVKVKLSVPKNTDGVVQFDIDVDAKPPAETQSAIYFVQPGGAISRRDPNQPQLPSMEDTDV
jgi:hypothetical protein